MRTQKLLSPSLIEDILASRRTYNTPGLAIAVVAGPSPVTGRTSWSEEIITDGIAKADGTPYAEDTIFPMASISKPFASICIGLLIDRKTVVPSTGEHLTWDTKMKDVLGDAWKLQDPVATEEATLRDATAMRCGIPPHAFAIQQEFPQQVVFRLRHLRQTRPFRDRFQYAGEGPTAMCYIVSILTGKSYADFIEENLFAPLGLTSTANGTKKLRKTGRLCDGFFHRGADSEKAGPEGWGTPHSIGWCTGNDDGEWSQGQTGLVTCIKDAARLLREMLEPTILPKSWTSNRHRPISILAPGEFPPSYFNWSQGIRSAGYGYGQYQMSYRGYEVLFTPGLEFGQSTYMVTLPGAALGCWVSVNEDGPGSRLIQESVAKIFDELLGLDPLPKSDPPPMIYEPIPPASVDIPFGSQDSSAIDAKESERLLLNPAGFFDPGHFRLVFEPFDMTDPSSPIVDVIRDATRASPVRKRLQHLLDPTPDLKFYAAMLDFKFISTLLVISTGEAGVYEWIALKALTLLDGKPGELGLRPLGPPGKLIVTPHGLGMFEGWIDRTGLTSRKVPAGWREDWRKVQVGCEAWFEKL